MASPQLENGYIRIATELLEAVVRTPLAGRHLRVWLFVLRKTYGFHKKTDKISLSQLVKGTRIDRSSICKIVKDLVARRTLAKSKGSYGINKNYDQWVVAPAPPPSGVDDNRVVAPAPHTKDTITKDTIRGIKKMEYIPINDEGQEVTKMAGLKLPVSSRGEFNYQQE